MRPECKPETAAEALHAPPQARKEFRRPATARALPGPSLALFVAAQTLDRRLGRTDLIEEVHERRVQPPGLPLVALKNILRFPRVLRSEVHLRLILRVEVQRPAVL